MRAAATRPTAGTRAGDAATDTMRADTSYDNRRTIGFAGNIVAFRSWGEGTGRDEALGLVVVADVCFFLKGRRDGFRNGAWVGVHLEQASFDERGRGGLCTRER